jgi:hypothetical protein
MKIKGWEKISGFTYKGFCIVNPIHNADETKYMADILDLNQQHKPKWELVVMTPENEDDWFEISIWDDNKFSTKDEMTKNMMSKISNFRQTFEGLIDEMIQLRLSLNGTTGPTQGIINQVQNAGTTFVVAKSRRSGSSFTQANILQAIKDLEEQLKQYV